jgi:prepilin-type N-terminal cleavage/methylation domain-containing protein
MKHQQRKSAAGSRGFTIIEVMIVLAIAGLIMLIVFLAVPAVQRNARNTQRKTDVAALLGGVSEYTNNNSGLLPGAVSISGATAYFCASGTCGTSGTPANLGYYNLGTVTIQKGGSAPSAPASGANDAVYILEGFSCSGNSPVAGSSRSVVAYFWIEPGSTAQCQGS